MKRLLKLTLQSVFLVFLTTSLVMAQEQVHSQCSVDFGGYTTCHWVEGGGNGFTFVPKGMVLEVTSATFAYFPAGGGTVGRADLLGRDAGTAVWRTQIVYIEPKKTVHLTFPAALRLEAGGFVEMGFTSDGPGSIFVSINGQLRK